MPKCLCLSQRLLATWHGVACPFYIDREIHMYVPCHLYSGAYKILFDFSFKIIPLYLKILIREIYKN